MGYFSVLDDSKNVVYIYSLIFGVSTGFFLQSLISSSYMNTISAACWILLTTFIVFQIFTIWSDIDLEWLAVWLAVVWIFAFYLSQNMRTMVRSDLQDSIAQDSVSGAVRIWIETWMVIFKFFELIGGIFVKDNKN